MELFQDLFDESIKTNEAEWITSNW